MLRNLTYVDKKNVIDLNIPLRFLIFHENYFKNYLKRL